MIPIAGVALVDLSVIALVIRDRHAADPSKVQPAGILISVVGALIVLFIYNRLVV